jgi:hypothetical protein
MAISLNSPNPDNYVIGKGRFWMKFLDGTPDPDWVRVGNVTKAEWTPDLKTLDHFDQQDGEKSIDKSVVQSKSAKLDIVMEEWTARNLRIMLMSNPVITGNNARLELFEANVIPAAVKFEASNAVGPQWSFEFHRVEFLPSNKIDLLSDEWAPLEASGNSVRVAGSFGFAESDFADVIPVNVTRPAIGTDSTPAVGELLICWPGTWSGTPATYAYQWKNAGVAIAGATAPTYTLVAGDSGDVITCTVTATNGAGSASSTSAGITVA